MIISEPAARPLKPSMMLIALATPPIENPVKRIAQTQNDSTQSTPGRSTFSIT